MNHKAKKTLKFIIQTPDLKRQTSGLDLMRGLPTSLDLMQNTQPMSIWLMCEK
jgi:hypothetical protein